MESKLVKFSNLFVRANTHGFTVLKHVNWKEVGVAITPAGSIVVFQDIDKMIYAVFSPMTGRYHIHIPYNDIMTIDERSVKVLEEVRQCLSLGLCYVENKMIYNINPIRIRGFIPFGMGRHVSNIKL